MSNDYTWWRNALKGEVGPIHEGQPQNGYYKKRASRGGPFVPMAIWFDDDTGEFVATIDGKQSDASDAWLWGAKNPISYEDFLFYNENGKWPADVDAGSREVTIGDNNPPDEFAVLKSDIEELAKDASEWLAKVGNIGNETDAEKAANYKDLLGKLYRKAEKERKAEKQPHLDASKEVDERYKPLKNEAEKAGKRVASVLSAYMVEQERIAREAAEAERRRLEEEQRKREEAARKAAEEAAAKNEPAPVVEVEPEPAPVVIPEKVKLGGTHAKATTLRSYWSAEITDYAKAVEHYATHSKVVEVIQQLADADARAMKEALNVPGVKLKEERRAA